jgi:hypothetical protein
MDANSMAEELDQQLDRATSFGSPGYEDEEYSSVLTEAMHVYIKQFIDRKNNRKGESLEETEVRNQGLSALIKRGAGLSASSDQTGVFANGVFYDLPEDFMYCIHEEGTIDKDNCVVEEGQEPTRIETEFRVIAHDEVTRLRKNKYKKPYYLPHGEAMTWRLVFSREVDGYVPANPATAKRHQLVTDGTFNVESYSINYLKYPDPIVVDRDNVADQRNCILDDSTHYVIIDIAKSLMLERVKEKELTNTVSPKDLE